VVAAECVFAHDSALALDLLQHTTGPRQTPPRLLAAAASLDLVTAMLGPRVDRAWWLARDRVPLGEAARAERRALVATPPGAGFLDPVAPSCEATREPWLAALRAYRDRLDCAGAGERTLGRITGDLVHMHANRMLGLVRPVEQEAMSVARAVMLAR
jgi:thiopeptide-type bacteriocin biosynthesis protein